MFVFFLFTYNKNLLSKKKYTCTVYLPDSFMTENADVFVHGTGLLQDVGRLRV